MATAAQDPHEAASYREVLRLLKRVEQLLEQFAEQRDAKGPTDRTAPGLSPFEGSPPNTAQRPPGARRRSAQDWDFTDREVQIIHLLCHPDGHTYDVIASILGIHRGTLNGHLVRIFARMQVHNRSSVVMKWIGREGNERTTREG